MSLNPLAPIFFPQYNSFPAVIEVLDNLKHMKPHLLPIVSGMSALNELYIPNIKTPDSDATTPENQLRLDPQPRQHLSTSPSLQTSVLQNQEAQHLRAIHKTTRHLQEHLKSDQLNQRALLLITLQLQNDFASLRYLLFYRWSETTQFTLHQQLQSVKQIKINLTLSLNFILS